MENGHFYIRHGKLRFSDEWQKVSGGKAGAQNLFQAVEAEFGPRVALRAVTQCCLWPFLLAFPIYKLGTRVRYERLTEIVLGVGDLWPNEGFFPHVGENGMPAGRPVPEFIPAPDYPGIKPGSLSARALIKLHESSNSPAPVRRVAAARPGARPAQAAGAVVPSFAVGGRHE